MKLAVKLYDSPENENKILIYLEYTIFLKVSVFVVVFDHSVEYSFNASKTLLVHSWFFWCSHIPQTSDTDGLQDL